MSYFDHLKIYKDNIALVTSKEKIKYNRLLSYSDDISKNIEERTLVILICKNSVESIAAYISFVKSTWLLPPRAWPKERLVRKPRCVARSGSVHLGRRFFIWEGRSSQVGCDPAGPMPRRPPSTAATSPAWCSARDLCSEIFLTGPGTLRP